jgi:hydrogenase expression/formation protein HypC
MCLAKPYKVKKIKGKKAVVYCGGRDIRVDCSMIPELSTGDYILLHDGIVIQKLEPDDALETLKMIEEFECQCQS